MSLFATCLVAGAPAWAALASAQGGADEYAVYLSPEGDDQAAGTSPSHPIRSLGRAERLLREASTNKTSFAVRFLPGTYHDLTVDWNFDSRGRDVLFAPEKGSAPGSVIIDGRGSNRTRLLTLQGPASSGGGESWDAHLTFQGLHIRNYCEAFSIGDHKTAVDITGVLFEGNRFENIGSKFEDRPLPGQWDVRPVGDCTAAIRLQHASGNIIRNNSFEHIENIAPELTQTNLYGPLHLHALYIAHGSSRNLIEQNKFDHFTGPAVRIRSRSDYNKVYRNEFSNAVYPPARKVKHPIYAVSQWYCAAQSEKCEEKAASGKSECPSIGTEVIDNKLSGQVLLYADETGTTAVNCPGRTNAGAKLSGNNVQP